MLGSEVDLQQQLRYRDKTISELKQEIEAVSINSDATIKMLKEKVQYLKGQLLSTVAKPETMKEPVVTTAASFHYIKPGIVLYLYSHQQYLETVSINMYIYLIHFCISLLYASSTYSKTTVRDRLHTHGHES